MIKFRPDVEGLRGLAVLLVLLCHASVPGFWGGFIGVDIFFVISGYLIYGILAREVQTTGRVDFANFYARRIKRLLGALFAMLGIVCAFCVLVLPNSIQAIQAPSAFFATIWASNIHFAFSNAGYFDDQTQLDVFLHTWSLGVEEQFYLLCPILFVIAARARTSGRGASLLLILVLASLLGCMFYSIHHANQAYYLMPTRIWQFMLGALAWHMPRHWTRTQNIGLVFVATALVLISDISPFPWPWAILPTVGTALILGNSNHNAIAYKVLNLSPFRFLGRISYSLYLWHWPLIVIFTLYRPIATWQGNVVLMVLAVLIATLSERWIERPLRRGKWAAGDVIKTGLVATAIFSSLFWIWKDSTARALQISSQRNDLTTSIRRQITLPDLYGAPGFDDFYTSDRLIPMFANRPASAPTKRVIIAGDSIAMQWLPAFEEIAKRNGWELVAATKSSCPMIDTPIVNGRIKRRYTECENWRSSLLKYIDEYSPDLLIMGNSMSLGLGEEDWIEGGRRILDRVTTPKREVVILAATPLLGFDPISCLSVNAEIRENGIISKGCASPLDTASQRIEKVRLSKIVANKPRASVLILDNVVCPNGQCNATKNGELIYRDGQHLNASFVQSVNRSVEERLFALVHRGTVRP